MTKTIIMHEIPKQLFEFHHFLSDGPYALGHKLSPSYEEHYDKEYADFYKEAFKEYEFSILDNGLFELGDSIDLDVLYRLGEEYKPSHLILPDALNNMELTKERAVNYIKKYGTQSTPKFIGVVQGRTIEEFLEMYEFFNKLESVDIIAIPFDFLPKDGFLTGGVDEWKLQRVKLVNLLLDEYNYELPKKLHLLGCATPNEFGYYRSLAKKFINSVDTSAPIVYGWNGVKFTNRGIPAGTEKPKDKLAENLNINLSKEQLQVIGHNVRSFRNLFTN